MLDKILSFLDSERDTVIDLQSSLVAMPALSPDNGGEGERAKADKLKEWLAEQGLPSVKEYNAPDDRVPCGHRPNLALVMPGQDASRTLWVIAHLDVVPIGDRALWSTDPFELHVDGDLIRGRGVEDNHQGVLSAVLLAKALKAHNVTPPINYGALLVADEETGSKYGLEYVLEHHGALFKKNDLFLVPDFGTPMGDAIEIAEKSMMWLKITVTGKQCHGSVPQRGINSLRAAADFILKIDRLKQIFGDSNPIYDPPASTFEPTKKEANVENINTVPGRDVFCIDCRVLPQYNIDDVMAEIRKLGDEVIKTHGVTIDYEKVQYKQAASATPEDSDIVKRLVPAIQAVYGGAPKPVGVGGGTVAAFLRARGYEAVVWANLEDNAHQPNERSSIKRTIGDAKVMARVLMG